MIGREGRVPSLLGVEGEAMRHSLRSGSRFLLLGLGIAILWSGAESRAESPPPVVMEDGFSATSTHGGAEDTATTTQGRLGGSDDVQPVIEESVGNSISSLFNAIQDNTGIISVNQSSGNLVHQSNLRAFYLSDQPDATFGIGIDQTSELDFVTLTESGVSARRNRLDGSFQDNTVLVGINQSAGNLNQQGNRAIVVIGGMAALSDAELQNNRATSSDIDEEAVAILEDRVTNSFSNSRGIFQVSQAAGSVNIQENNLAISFRQIKVE